MSLIKCERGQDLVEYSLLLGFIALACAAAVLQTGQAITNLWSILSGRYGAAGM